MSRAQFYDQFGSSEDVDDECNVSMSESDVETDANDSSEERESPSEDVTIVDSAASAGPVTATAATPAQ